MFTFSFTYTGLSSLPVPMSLPLNHLPYSGCTMQGRCREFEPGMTIHTTGGAPHTAFCSAKSRSCRSYLQRRPFNVQGVLCLRCFFRLWKNNCVSRKPCKRRSDLVLNRQMIYQNKPHYLENQVVREPCKRRTACTNYHGFFGVMSTWNENKEVGTIPL